MNQTNLVELMIVGACLRIQDEVNEDSFFKKNADLLNGSRTRYVFDLMELTDRVITMAGFGPEDWS